MEIIKHNLTKDDLSKVFEATNGVITDCYIWLNAHSGRKAYIAAKVDLGFLKVQMFSVELNTKSEAEEFLNSFEFDVEYEINGCECEC